MAGGDAPLVEMLRRHEGVRHKPYRDSVGKLTIGVGRNLDDVGLSDDEIDYLLQNDIRRAREDARQLPYFFELNGVRRMVIVNMVFNMGLPTVEQFQAMGAALKRGDYGTAADEMLDSKWARQVGSRADELAEIMRWGYL